MALPNFIAEYKGKDLIKTAHQRARLDGGIATQGLFRLYSHLGCPEKCLDRVLVGAMEYNGDIIIGNVHWATELASKLGVNYHMHQVMLHSTRGFDFEDFVKKRAIVRNFRRYFADKREVTLKEL